MTKAFQAVLLGLVAAVAALGAGAARADVPQTPITTACPAAFAVLSVSALEAQGPYKSPRLIDTAGNGNGEVCGFPLPDGYRAADCRIGGTIACILERLGLPVYEFTDDDSPAAVHATGGR
jgi:hypothetical protein